ncbi:MAG: hypothetical protein V4591_05445 [Bdellovibrionota bacterium]
MKKLLYLSILAPIMMNSSSVFAQQETMKCVDGKICSIENSSEHIVNVGGGSVAYGINTKFEYVLNSSGAISIGLNGSCDGQKMDEGSFCVIANETCALEQSSASNYNSYHGKQQSNFEPAEVKIKCKDYSNISFVYLNKPNKKSTAVCTLPKTDSDDPSISCKSGLAPGAAPIQPIGRTH